MIRLGRWQDVLADVGEVDAVITDVPYSERTVKGHRSGSLKRDKDNKVIGRGTLVDDAIKYAGLTEQQTRDVATWAMSISRRWFVSFCDHAQWMWMEDTCRRNNWMTFQPIPWVKTDGGTPRFTADGPSSSSEWILITRPRKKCITRYRPGDYSTAPNYDKNGVVGAKPVGLMRAVIRDYSEPGDLVCDPFVGSGTTAIAALSEGRRFVGSEMDPKHHAIATARLARGYTPDLF